MKDKIFEILKDKQLIRLFMILSTVLMTVFLLSSMHLEFTVDADGKKSFFIDFNRESAQAVDASNNDHSTMWIPALLATGFLVFNFDTKGRAESHVLRGNNLYNSKDFKSAFEEYNKAIAFNPKNEVAYLNRGMCHAVFQDFLAAINDYNKALELEPNGNLIYQNRAMAHYRLGNYERALADCNQAIYLNHSDAVSYYTRSLCYQVLGDAEQAEADLAKALELGFDSSMVM